MTLALEIRPIVTSDHLVLLTVTLDFDVNTEQDHLSENVHLVQILQYVPGLPNLRRRLQGPQLDDDQHPEWTSPVALHLDTEILECLADHLVAHLAVMKPLGARVMETDIITTHHNLNFVVS